jgi:putative aminopeptidase FrvX
MTDSTPALSEARLELIRRLSDAVAVSGDEGRVRAIVRHELESVADEIRTDRMGNLLAVRRSDGPAKLRVMLAAHMDEVGFIVRAIDHDGALRVAPVGGLAAERLVGKRVWVGPAPSLGVVGVTPIHLVKKSDSQIRPDFSSLRIDLGASADQVRDLGIRPGVIGTFATRFRMENDHLRGKALDDRLGVSLLIELLRRPVKGVDLLGAFTVQEEIGARGATVAAFTFEPDIGIALDCTPAMDLPTSEGRINPDPNTRLGEGPAVYVADGKTVSDPRLVSMAIETAERLEIPFQIRQPGSGGTDARAIQRSKAGVPVISISVPGRYMHSAVALAIASDVLATEALMKGFLASLADGWPSL